MLNCSICSSEGVYMLKCVNNNNIYEYRCENHLTLNNNIKTSTSKTGAIVTTSIRDKNNTISFKTISGIMPNPYLSEPEPEPEIYDEGSIRYIKNDHPKLVFKCSIGTPKYYEVDGLFWSPFSSEYGAEHFYNYDRNEKEIMINTYDLKKYIELFFKAYHGFNKREVDDLFIDNKIVDDDYESIKVVTWDFINTVEQYHYYSIKDVIIDINYMNLKGLTKKFTKIMEHTKYHEQIIKSYHLGNILPGKELENYERLYKELSPLVYQREKEEEQITESNFPDDLKNFSVEKEIETLKKNDKTLNPLFLTKGFIYFDIILAYNVYFDAMYRKMIAHIPDAYSFHTTLDGCESEYIIIPFTRDNVDNYEHYKDKYYSHYEEVLNDTGPKLVSEWYIKKMRDDKDMFTLIAVSKEDEVIGSIKMSYRTINQYDKYQEDAVNKCAWMIRDLLDPNEVNLKNKSPLLSNCVYVHLTTVSPSKRGNYAGVMLKFFLFKMIEVTRKMADITHILSHSVNPISKGISEKFGANINYNENSNEIKLLRVMTGLKDSGDNIDTVINVIDPGFRDGMTVIEKQLLNCEHRFQKKKAIKRERGSVGEEPGSKRQRTKIFIKLDHFFQ